MGSILSARHDGEGMKRVYENGLWMLGLKNYKAANDESKFDEIELHRDTDELFVLVAGECALLEAEGSPLRFEALRMERGVLYVIPAGLWHTTITVPGTKLVLVEAPGTGAANSEVRRLGEVELAAARAAIAAVHSTKSRFEA